MIFNTFTYYLLFLLPAAIFYRCMSPRVRPWIIAGFGCLFFAYFAWSLAGLRGTLCLGIFLCEAVYSRFYAPGSRWCLAGMVQALLVLGLFKYWNFFTGIIFWHHHDPLHWQGAFLPLGISFFTFEFYHYASDRRTGTAEKGSLGEYLAFIFFFPTMVAGPIKRFQDFLPKLRAEPGDWQQDWERGLTRILTGLAKKFAIADLMTAWTSHLNRHDIAAASRHVLPLWLLAYGIQIYADFSAYSDIAIGSARLFGLRVPENFDWPYGRRNIQSFWRCWHMSLTRWLIDYVYIPLGGSRVSEPRVYFNIFAVMLLCGLWHGAGWNFLAWGLCHALLLSTHRLWRHLRGAPSTHTAAVFASRALTFLAVNAAWAFFCMDIHTAMLFYKRLLVG